MHDFTFNDILERRGVDLKSSRIVRHDWRALQAWRHSVARFDHFVSYQRADNKTPYRAAEMVFQFVPAAGNGALFVGAHRVLEGWCCPPDNRLPALYDQTADDGKGNQWDHQRYDLERVPEFEDLVARVLIDWGPSTRSWSQWPERRNKPIVEIRANPMDDPFPGFAAFRSTIDEVELLPTAWQGALASVSGVYLLVCPNTGELYVGSAYGSGGFWGRWSSYAANGHGGNRLLMQRPRVNYAVSILEVASPDMSASDIIHREAAWKIKLGSRSHGLNAN